MSVTRVRDSSLPYAYGDSIWSLERVLRFFSKIILDLLFFIALVVNISYYVDITNPITLIIVVFFVYIISDIISFIFSYALVKFIFTFLKRDVKRFSQLIKNRTKKRKIWIYFIALFFEAIFYTVGVSRILVGYIPVEWIALSYIIAWIILMLITKGLARFVYFLFYQF